MRHVRIVLLTGIALLGSIGAPLAAASPAPASLSVLTYNIHGLPWPIASDREDDFARIEARLNAMRRAGVQPHIVVLQEAFTADAAAIGRRSGYRYIVDGPAAGDVNPGTPTAADRQFSADASWLKGERSGKLVSSGLQILSDYPILGVRRMAFPSYACAGFDCLANKGVLMAAVAVPGSAAPVVVTTAHFNSRNSSGVPDARSNYAYRRQLDAAGAFLAKSPWRDYPMIFAGDFNVGKSAPRRNYFASSFAGWWDKNRTGPVNDAMHACRNQPGRFPAAAEESFSRSKDWQLFASTRLAALSAEAISVPFGRARDGSMLSDHLGYTASYRIMSAAMPRTASWTGAWAPYARLK